MFEFVSLSSLVYSVIWSQDKLQIYTENPDSEQTIKQNAKQNKTKHIKIIFFFKIKWL